MLVGLHSLGTGESSSLFNDGAVIPGTQPWYQRSVSLHLYFLMMDVGWQWWWHYDGPSPAHYQPWPVEHMVPVLSSAQYNDINLQKHLLPHESWHELV